MALLNLLARFGTSKYPCLSLYGVDLSSVVSVGLSLNAHRCSAQPSIAGSISGETNSASMVDLDEEVVKLHRLDNLVDRLLKR